MAELYLPDARDWIASYDAGHQTAMAGQKEAATRQAGGLMASGDYAGAAKALYTSGDLQNGSAVAQAGQQQASYADKLTRQKSVQAKLAAGDISGAYAAAGTDADLLGGLDKVADHAKETTATLAGALQGLKTPDGQWLPPDQARAKFAAMKPTLLARGLDPQQINGFDPTPENLSAIQGQVLGLTAQLAYHKPDWHEVKGADGSTTFEDLNPANRQSGAPEQAPAAAAPAQQTTPLPTGGVYDQVGHIATQNGAKPEEVSYLQRLAQVESHGDPSAQNGSSTGVFQFHPDTFAGLGGRDIHSVPEQTFAALSLQRRDRQNLQQIGVDPTDANVYIMHQQGAGGGRALLTAQPDAKAVDVLTPVYGSAALAQKAIVGNGGTPDMTAGQFVGMWRQRWGNGGAPVRAAPSEAPVAAAAHIGGPPTVAGSAAQPPEWVSDGHGLLINRKTGDRKEDPGMGGDGGELTDSATELLAGRYIKDGTLPTRISEKDKAKILNRASEVAKTLNLTAGDLIAGTADVKATAAALNKQTTQLAQVKAFEDTALKNADLAVSLAPKGAGPMKSPVLNRWVQTGRRAVMGDPGVTQYEVALGTFLDEYAKIVSGATGSQGSTDASRREAYERLSKYASQGQLQAGVETMKQEMNNRITSMQDVQDGLRSHLRGQGASDAPPAAPGKRPPLSAFQR